MRTNQGNVPSSQRCIGEWDKIKILDPEASLSQICLVIQSKREAPGTLSAASSWEDS